MKHHIQLTYAQAVAVETWGGGVRLQFLAMGVCVQEKTITPLQALALGVALKAAAEEVAPVTGV